jgi:hypothetical protein
VAENKPYSLGSGLGNPRTRTDYIVLQDNKIMIKVEPNSYSDAPQSPSYGQTKHEERSVLYAVKTEALVSCTFKGKQVSSAEHCILVVIVSQNFLNIAVGTASVTLPQSGLPHLADIPNCNFWATTKQTVLHVFHLGYRCFPCQYESICKVARAWKWPLTSN